MSELTNTLSELIYARDQAIQSAQQYGRLLAAVINRGGKGSILLSKQELNIPDGASLSLKLNKNGSVRINLDHEE